MQEFLEIAKYILPSVIVFGTAYYLIKMMLNSEMNKRKMEAALANKKIVVPMQLRAFERLALFLERISFNSLIIRTMQPQMNTKQLQIALLSAIRQEYEHNMSQQIYVSDNTWQAVKMAKENSIKIINSIADSIEKNQPAMELSKKLLTVVMQAETTPSDLALKVLKNELQTIL